MDKKLIPYLYVPKTCVPDILEAYGTPMLLSENILTRAKGSQLLKYRAILLDTEFRKLIHERFEELYRELKKKFSTLKFSLVGRSKALISTINKLEALECSKIKELQRKFISNQYSEELSTFDDSSIKEAMIRDMLSKSFKNEYDCEIIKNQLQEKKFIGEIPFERMNDYFAFRIIIEDMYPEELISELYEVLEFTIQFFKRKGYDFIEHSILLETGKKKEIRDNLGKDIYIPNRDFLKPELKKYVKDYVINPKYSGYQSLHVVVHDPFTDRKFEIQIRTRTMDIIADTIASHTAYKESKYSTQQANDESIDYSKIKIRGFRYIKYQNPLTGIVEEKFKDTAGIKISVPLILINN